MNGEYECAACGLIQGQAIDMGKDYRTFADGSGANNERHGMKKTYLLHDGGLSTDIGRGNKDAFGVTIKEISVSDCIVCVCTTNEAEFKRVASATWCKPCMNFSDWPATWD